MENIVAWRPILFDASNPLLGLYIMIFLQCVVGQSKASNRGLLFDTRTRCLIELYHRKKRREVFFFFH